MSAARTSAARMSRKQPLSHVLSDYIVIGTCYIMFFFCILFYFTGKTGIYLLCNYGSLFVMLVLSAQLSSNICLLIIISLFLHKLSQLPSDFLEFLEYEKTKGILSVNWNIHK